MSACGCTANCGDLPEYRDDPLAVCKGLPPMPEPPLVEIELVRRWSGGSVTDGDRT